MNQLWILSLRFFTYSTTRSENETVRDRACTTGTFWLAE